MNGNLSAINNDIVSMPYGDMTLNYVKFEYKDANN